MDGVFTHVRNLRRAATWDSAAFGLPLKKELERHYPTLNAPGEHPWGTLDDHPAEPTFEFRPAAHPALSLHSRNLEASRGHLRALDAPFAGDVVAAHPGLTYFVFRGPDGHAPMVLQRT